MTEIMQVIAEAEGVRTPKKKRSRKEVAEIVGTFLEETAAKKKAAKKTAIATPKPVAAKNADSKPAPKFAEPIKMNFISATGYVREAGFSAKTNMFYVGFAKSTWAMPSSQTEWDEFEKAVADPKVEIDAYYRKAFRGRTAQMLPVRLEVSK